MNKALHPGDLRPQADAGAPAEPRRSGASLSELITVQWQRERGDQDLDGFLLAIYFMRLGTLVDRAFDRTCQKKYGVNGGDMRMLLALRRAGPPYFKRPTDLFRTMLVTSGAITKKVDRMVAAGYVERLPDPGHNGGFLVRLTKAGLHVAEDTVDWLIKDSLLAPALSQFSPEERVAGARFALRVLSTLEHAQADGLAGGET